MIEEKYNNLYLYRGKYVEMNPDGFDIEYVHILTLRKILGFKLKDKEEKISEEEFIELSENELYNFRYMKEFREGDIFDKIGIFSLLSGGIPCVYKRVKYDMKYLFKDDYFILRTVCSNNYDNPIPAELIEYSCWGESMKKQYAKIIEKHGGTYNEDKR